MRSETSDAGPAWFSDIGSTVAGGGSVSVGSFDDDPSDFAVCRLAHGGVVPVLP